LDPPEAGKQDLLDFTGYLFFYFVSFLKKLTKRNPPAVEKKLRLCLHVTYSVYVALIRSDYIWKVSPSWPNFNFQTLNILEMFSVACYYNNTWRGTFVPSVPNFVEVLCSHLKAHGLNIPRHAFRYPPEQSNLFRYPVHFQR
jgi:hypothetical protein